MRLQLLFLEFQWVRRIIIVNINNYVLFVVLLLTIFHISYYCFYYIVLLLFLRKRNIFFPKFIRSYTINKLPSVVFTPRHGATVRHALLFLIVSVFIEIKLFQVISLNETRNTYNKLFTKKNKRESGVDLTKHCFTIQTLDLDIYSKHF